MNKLLLEYFVLCGYETSFPMPGDVWFRVGSKLVFDGYLTDKKDNKLAHVWTITEKGRRELEKMK